MLLIETEPEWRVRVCKRRPKSACFLLRDHTLQRSLPPLLIQDQPDVCRRRALWWQPGHTVQTARDSWQLKSLCPKYKLQRKQKQGKELSESRDEDQPCEMRSDWTEAGWGRRCCWCFWRTGSLPWCPVFSPSLPLFTCQSSVCQLFIAQPTSTSDSEKLTFVNVWSLENLATGEESCFACFGESSQLLAGLSGTLNCSVGFPPCLCLAFARPIVCTSDSSQVLPKQPDTFSNSIFTPKENKVVCQPAMSLNYYIQYLVSEFFSPNTNSELTANTDYRYKFSRGVLLTSIHFFH